jgi:hypothetical protein
MCSNVMPRPAPALTSSAHSGGEDSNGVSRDCPGAHSGLVRWYIGPLTSRAISAMQHAMYTSRDEVAIGPCALPKRMIKTPRKL